MLIFVYLAPSTKIRFFWIFFKITLKAPKNNAHLRETNETCAKFKATKMLLLVASFQFL